MIRDKKTRRQAISRLTDERNQLDKRIDTFIENEGGLVAIYKSNYKPWTVMNATKQQEHVEIQLKAQQILDIYT